SRIMSFGGSYYALVIVDDYSRYTWTLFITYKNDAFQAFRKLAKVIQNKKHLKIISIRSDHGGETLLNDTPLPKYFWVEAINTACYTMNMALIRPILKKTPYELFNGRKPKISHVHVFGYKCFVLNNGK
ncbi:Retrovirus-related Pol polyprotein from transposon TNT 1-94, partial [Glycine soja]